MPNTTKCVGPYNDPNKQRITVSVTRWKDENGPIFDRSDYSKIIVPPLQQKRPESSKSSKVKEPEHWTVKICDKMEFPFTLWDKLDRSPAPEISELEKAASNMPVPGYMEKQIHFTFHSNVDSGKVRKGGSKGGDRKEDMRSKGKPRRQSKTQEKVLGARKRSV